MSIEEYTKMKEAADHLIASLKKSNMSLRQVYAIERMRELLASFEAQLDSSVPPSTTVQG
jgi:hypothetical protein